MSLRVVLYASAAAAIIFGLMMAAAPDATIQNFQLGQSDVPSRLFARVFGGTLLSLGIVNIVAAGDRGSRALGAVVLGNFLVHIVGLAVDYTEKFPASPGWYVGTAVHVVFILAFGYYLANWSKVTSSA